SLDFKRAHDYASLPEAAHGWLHANYTTLPSHIQPAREDLRAFANLFASYLETSFEMLDAPGRLKVSPNCHCFCPICSSFVNAPRLVTKKLGRFDKQRARKLQLAAIARVASAHGASSSEP